MTKYFRYLLIIITLSTLASCEKEVHINLASSPPKVVVQGAIETGQPPYVFLTSSIGFFSKIDLSTLQNTFLHGALITVSDGTKTITLKEYSFDTSTNATFYIYTIDTNDLANLMLGEVEKYYTLSITYNAKTYTSVTKIPRTKDIDSLWLGTPVFQSDRTPAGAMQLFCNYQDADTMGNFVRYFTRRNNENFYPSGIFTDEVVNGMLVSDIDLYGGYEDSAMVRGDSLIYFYPGDTVTLKWTGIDRGVYNFWNTFDFASGSVGNPFSSPINVRTNITNGALGIWEGDGTIYHTIVVPE